MCLTKKEVKRLYDQEYRTKNTERIKQRKHEYFIKDYAENPEKYKKERQRRQKSHNEYCMTPEYRAWKKEYDRKYRAKKFYGDLWECSVLLNEISKFVDNRQAVQDKRTMNKMQKRKRKQVY